MATELGLTAEADEWTRQAADVKKRLFEVCFDEEDCFFYDVDKNGIKRKHLSSTIFHLFMEGVLDKKDDAELISALAVIFQIPTNLRHHTRIRLWQYVIRREKETNVKTVGAICQWD